MALYVKLGKMDYRSATTVGTDSEGTIRWRCPARGCYRSTLQKPEETEQQATNRLIDDHIKLGCSAYFPTSVDAVGRKGDS